MSKKSDQVSDSNDSTTGNSSGHQAPLWLHFGRRRVEDAAQDDLITDFENTPPGRLGTVHWHTPITID